mgnify:CR=1 FL=1
MNKTQAIWLATFAAWEGNNGIEVGYQVFSGKFPEGVWMVGGVIYMQWEDKPLPLTCGTVLVDVDDPDRSAMYYPVADIFATKEEAEKYAAEGNAVCPFPSKVNQW